MYYSPYLILNCNNDLVSLIFPFLPSSHKPPKPFQNHCPRSLVSLKTVKKTVGWLWWVFRDQHHRRHHQHIGSLLGMTSKLLWLDSWRWNAGRKRSFWGRSYKTHWKITLMLCIYSINIPLNGVGGKGWFHLKIIWGWGANQRGWQLWRYIFRGIINCLFILILVNIMHFYLFRKEYSWYI